MKVRIARRSHLAAGAAAVFAATAGCGTALGATARPRCRPRGAAGAGVQQPARSARKGFSTRRGRPATSLAQADGSTGVATPGQMATRRTAAR